MLWDNLITKGALQPEPFQVPSQPQPPPISNTFINSITFRGTTAAAAFVSMNLNFKEYRHVQFWNIQDWKEMKRQLPWSARTKARRLSLKAST